MARNNLTWIKVDITGDIYYDNFHLDSKDVQYLRLYLMIKGVVVAAAVKGVRVCVYGSLAERVDTEGCKPSMWAPRLQAERAVFRAHPWANPYATLT